MSENEQAAGPTPGAVAALPDAPTGATARLADLMPILAELGALFQASGHELAIVGGPVRDAYLGRLTADIDLTTDALPNLVLPMLRSWADAVWDVGIKFGTVGARKGDVLIEITTYRAESYDRESRKPHVDYGTTLAADLARRDFTINAMAVRLPSMEFVDLFGGMSDLAAKVIKTPGTPEASFDDDPLRMLRAARFASQLQFTVAPEVVVAMTEMAPRLEIVSAERIRDELNKLLLGADPRAGLALLVDTGLAEFVLPELPGLKLEIDEWHRHKDVYDHSLTVLDQAINLETSHLPASGPDLVLRLAALLHDIGKPKTRKYESDGGVSFHHHEVVGARMVKKRLTALRYPNEVVDDVSKLVELHLRFHGYGSGEWTDSAVRRYVRDAGPLITRLHKLTRADSTTRNARKAASLQRTYDSLEDRIAVLEEQEELASMRPDLDGNQIMSLLGVKPGPVVGRAYNHLLELRLDHGPLGEERAIQALGAWWHAQPEHEG